MNELVKYVKSLQHLYEQTGFILYGDAEIALISNGTTKGAIEFSEQDKQYQLGVWDEEKKTYTAWDLVHHVTTVKLKVFSIDETDFVVAKSEEEAKAWYEQFLPRDEVEACFDGEVSLGIRINIDKNELTEAEKQGVIALFGQMPEEEYFKVTLKDWLDIVQPTGEPFIIASTES